MISYLKMLAISLISGIFTALPVSYSANYAFLTSVTNFSDDSSVLGFYFAVISAVFSIVVFFYLKKIYRKAFRSLFTRKKNRDEKTGNYRKVSLNLLLSLIPAAVMFIPTGKGKFVLDMFTSLLGGDNLLLTAFCCFGSGIMLFVAMWYTRQKYAETKRITKTQSVVRFSIYQIPAYILPGLSNVAVGSTSLLLTDVEQSILVRELLLFLAPSMFVVNAARIVRFILADVVFDPLLIVIAVAGALAGSVLVIHFISRINIRKVFLFFSIYSIIFGIFIAAAAFIM